VAALSAAAAEGAEVKVTTVSSAALEPEPAPLSMLEQEDAQSIIM
jgi:hypothetical protein